MVLIMGIGNSLLQDEGIGFHLLERLRLEKSHWPVEFLDGGTLSFNLTTAIESCSHLIVLDAANLHQAPGTVKSFLNTELDDFLNKPGKSVHEVSLSDLFDMTRLTESLPDYRALIGIQPKTISWGENLTAEVYQSQSKAMQQVESILLDWGILSTQKNSAAEDVYEA